MGDFVTYPLEESYFSSFPADAWNCSVPLTDLLAMFAPSTSREGGSQQALPSWRPSRPFPPQRYIAVAAQVVHHGISRLPMVARVTLADYRGNVVFDSFVRPTQPVSDYRTAQTGLTPQSLAGAPSFPDVQQHVAQLIRGKIIIGYALWLFLSVMGLSHPAIDTRDTALFLPFRRTLRARANVTVPLRTLVNALMGREYGLHGEISIEEARATLDLFRSCEQVWEGIVASGSWPCALPPEAYANCFT